MRLDVYLLNKKVFESRNKALNAILRGEIYVNGVKVTKPSYKIDEENEVKIEYKFLDKFVSQGGYKMKKALEDFNFDVKNFICADFGASTGGFTDCLLQRGAKLVYAIDLNDDLLHYSLKTNEKVVPIITNAKLITKESFRSEIDLIVCDLSFISSTSFFPIFFNVLKQTGYVILLIKPQFETDKRTNFKNGIIRNSNTRKNACIKIIENAIKYNFTPLKLTKAPIYADKNVEYLLLLKKGDGEIFDYLNYDY